MIVQGCEAGGHRGVFVDDDSGPGLSLLSALQLVRARVDLPLIASGSIMTGAAVAPTVLTRAFSGRLARGIVNRLHSEHGDAAPRAYPEVHHLTSPLRAHARAIGDPDLINLWAGQAHALAGDLPAAELTRRLAADARAAIAAAAGRLDGSGPGPGFGS